MESGDPREEGTRPRQTGIGEDCGEKGAWMGGGEGRGAVGAASACGEQR